MHFYPGVAEYQDEKQGSYRVFLNENTLRDMDPSFAGCPVYAVTHVNGVPPSLDELRKEADGWVIESFFNAADGKHWVKFIVVSERGRDAVKRGMRLSNAYIPQGFAQGGLWNGVEYAKEVTGGKFEHLAIVPNPRYQESVVLTPEEFKAYNAEKLSELSRIANSNDRTVKENSGMAFGIFKKQKVENSKDLEGMIIELPKSKREIPLEMLVKNADEMAMAEGQKRKCNGDDMVDVDGSEMSLNDLLGLHRKNSEELAALKKEKENAAAPSEEEEPVENEDDEEAKKKALELAESEAAKKKENAMAEAEAKKAAEAKKKAEDEKKKNFETLKNAHLRSGAEEVHVVQTMSDRAAEGRRRYGSAK